MRRHIKEARSCVTISLMLLFGFLSAGSPASAQTVTPPIQLAGPPSFQAGSASEGWDVGLKSGAPVELPAEVTFRLRVPVGGAVTAKAVTENPADKPLLEAEFKLTGPNNAAITARSSGAQMNTHIKSKWQSGISYEYYADIGNPCWGSLAYVWRFPVVKNLWDEGDRRDIGSDYASLVPFAEKDFYLRLVMTEGVRQIWVDDRLVSEERAVNPATARFELQTAGGASVLAADKGTPSEISGFMPLSLTRYSHERKAQNPADGGQLLNVQAPDGRTIPMLATLRLGADMDLGESLYRYRMTHGTGPDAPYIEPMHAYPDTFRIDPAQLSFRVPYRQYQNAWLLAWVDDEENAIPRGVFRFYQEDAGYPAATDFEITQGAMQKKLVTKLPNRTPDGKTLYLIRVPIDTDAFYGFRDPEQRVVDFELSKPVALSRSYPDPIYYGYHAAGLPSSIHVVGITLEESPFDYEVKPRRFAHVFERPEAPAYAVTVANHSPTNIEAQVTLATTSFDGQERQGVEGKASVAPGASVDVALSFDLKQNGWHALKVRVEAAGVVRENTLSLLVLPPNTRTYGYAPNETRFGLWLCGGYPPLRAKRYEQNAEILALLRKLGIRRASASEMWFKPEDFKQAGFLPQSMLTMGMLPPFLNKDKDPAGWQKALDGLLDAYVKPYAGFPESGLYYGGEWWSSMEMSYAPWPLYTGDGDRDLTPEERKNGEDQTKVFTAIGREIRAKYPQTKLYLQWGAPLGTLMHIRCGFPKDLVDKYGMDVPVFEQLPELPRIDNPVLSLWELRAETKRLGWPHLPIAWAEGPFLPTRPGALTENEQADNLIRVWLAALAFGVDQFDCAIQDFDRGDYYGAEHYWGGVFRRRPMQCPKPSAAAVATATTMLCGADPMGGVDTGCLTTYCLAFQRSKTKEMIYALWRVRGTVEATVRVRGQQAVVTDAMGNARILPAANGAVRLTISSSPVWLTGVEGIEGFQFDAPVYDSAPAKITRPLAEMTAKNWTYDGSEDKAYAKNHFLVRRVVDKSLKAEFGAGEASHEDAVAITLPEDPGDRPLANRYGALVARKPIPIPGKVAALGLWIKGNASWGRIVYQLRDAKGEIWVSAGTKDQWNCDDMHGWSYVSFEGWRYVRFPLPGNHPYDTARELETTWWGSRGGDGIVDLPLKLEKIFVEARNEVPYLGEMKLVRDRSYKLSQLVAEYSDVADASASVVARYKHRRPVPEWSGPSGNPIAKLAAEGVADAPAIEEFTEPQHSADGRSMVIHFAQTAGLKYNLYLARYQDGRGAELLTANVEDGQQVGGLRPETDLYLFLTAVSKDNKESKPSKAFKLITHDRFLEK